MNEPCRPRPTSAHADSPPWAALAVALLIAGVAASTLITMLGAAFEYRRDLLLQQPWRVLTAHLAHINGTHALVNLLGWGVLLLLFRDVLSLRRQLILLPAIGALIALGLAAFLPQLLWYRGLSGVLHGLFFAAATLQLIESIRSRGAVLWPALLLVGGAVKVLIEQPFSGELIDAPWLGVPVVPQAHALGAVSGTICAALLPALIPRRAGAAATATPPSSR